MFYGKKKKICGEIPSAWCDSIWLIVDEMKVEIEIVTISISTFISSTITSQLVMACLVDCSNYYMFVDES